GRPRGFRPAPLRAPPQVRAAPRGSRSWRPRAVLIPRMSRCRRGARTVAWGTSGHGGGARRRAGGGGVNGGAGGGRLGGDGAEPYRARRPGGGPILIARMFLPPQM